MLDSKDKELDEGKSVVTDNALLRRSNTVMIPPKCQHHLRWRLKAIDMHKLTILPIVLLFIRNIREPPTTWKFMEAKYNIQIIIDAMVPHN